MHSLVVVRTLYCSSVHLTASHVRRRLCSADWEVMGEETGEKQLWEDNWDDDNVEDDFSQQLR